jgi:mono/diheme cytochrome c family protein
MRKTLLVSIAVAASACSGGSGPGGSNGNGGSGGGGNTPAMDHSPDAPFFAGMKSGADQLALLCARGHQDEVAKQLCGTPSPSVTSLSALQHAVGFFGGKQPPGFALVGHSTSLVIRQVSAVNPRAILFTAPSQQPTTQTNDGSFIADPGFVTMGFVRGSQFAELAAHDPQANTINFYLVRFTQDCNFTSSGCSNGDLYTPAVEKNWRAVSVYDDEDLKDTVFDCRQCHQPDGPSTTKMLRMQERRAPWTHWLRNNTNEPGGVALVQDFRAAHGQSEDYAAIPGNLLDTPDADPLVFEGLVDNNSVSPQPNEFDTAKIEQQVDQSAPMQPATNMPPGQSAAWQQIFDVSSAGDAIPVPYHDVKITDPQKLATVTSAYQQFLKGALPAASLPDVSDVLLDDALPAVGLRPMAGATGQQILQQMCQRCHNDKLDPSLSRAQFDVTKLATMPAATKAMAVARITAAQNSTALMPPARFGALSADEIATLTAFLTQ